MRELDEHGRALEELRAHLARMRRHVDERRAELQMIEDLVDAADRRLAELQDDVARDRTFAGSLVERVRVIAARAGVELRDPPSCQNRSDGPRQPAPTPLTAAPSPSSDDASEASASPATSPATIATTAELRHASFGAA